MILLSLSASLQNVSFGQNGSIGNNLEFLTSNLFTLTICESKNSLHPCFIFWCYFLFNEPQATSTPEM
jgi:hypothetical protein